MKLIIAKLPPRLCHRCIGGTPGNYVVKILPGPELTSPLCPIHARVALAEILVDLSTNMTDDERAGATIEAVAEVPA